MKLIQNTETNISGAYLPGVHYDLDLEQQIIGVILHRYESENHPYNRTIGLVESDMFYDRELGSVYSLMQDMYSAGLPIDLLTTTHELRKAGIGQIHGQSMAFILAECCSKVVSSANLEHWCLILRELALERELIKLRREKREGDPLEQAKIIDETIKRILTVNATDDWRDMSQVMISLLNHREAVKDKKLMGVSTGFPTIDKITYGLQPGQLVIVAARPSVGKTAFASGIAMSCAKNGDVVGVISLEMPEEQIGARIASLYSDLEFWRIYRNRHKDHQEEERFIQQAGVLAQLPIFISDKTNVNATAIRAKSEKLKRKAGLALLIIDYLQLVESEGKQSDTREREVSKLSRSLKLLAMEMKIPVIVLCQLNRENTKERGKPRMSQIRESGAIEQDADVGNAYSS